MLTDKSIFQRAQDVLLNIEECTPEDMYEDWQFYFHQKREEWRAATASAADIQSLKNHLIRCVIFYINPRLHDWSALVRLQNFLKATKLREGWDTVQKVWIKDVEEATTVCSLLYLMKQLRVYIGRQVKS